MSCGRTRKSPTGQIPNAWSLLSGPKRLPSSDSARNDDTFGSQSIAATIAGTASTTTPAAKTPSLTGSDRDRPAPQKHRGDHRRREEPGGRGQAQHAHDRRTNGCERQDGSSGRARPERPGHEHREQREEPGSGELLDSAPERVAEQDRRLCRDEGGERSHRPQRDERLQQRVQRERRASLRGTRCTAGRSRRGRSRRGRARSRSASGRPSGSRPRASSPASPRRSTARARRGRARVPSHGRSSRSTSRCRRA